MKKEEKEAKGAKKGESYFATFIRHMIVYKASNLAFHVAIAVTKNRTKASLQKI